MINPDKVAVKASSQVMRYTPCKILMFTIRDEGQQIKKTRNLHLIFGSRAEVSCENKKTRSPQNNSVLNMPDEELGSIVSTGSITATLPAKQLKVTIIICRGELRFVVASHVIPYRYVS